MSRWTNPEAWARLVSGEDCPICRDGGPTNRVAELEVSTLTMGDGPTTLPGTAALFLRRHAVELHELSPEEGAAFMRDVQRVSRALAEATGAVKMNYEVHGNTIPHLHMHFFPRYAGDPFENAPINPRLPPPVDNADEIAAIKQRVVRALGAGPAGGRELTGFRSR
jgi:diadenosine tetraphosphate (Ap4A) HIT family hydrolase